MKQLEINNRKKHNNSFTYSHSPVRSKQIMKETSKLDNFPRKNESLVNSVVKINQMETINENQSEKDSDLETRKLLRAKHQGMSVFKEPNPDVPTDEDAEFY